MWFLSFDTAKLGIKKARWTKISIGREFVGVLVGVLPFSVLSVGVLGKKVGVCGSFGGSFLRSQTVAHRQADMQVIPES